MSHAPAPYSLSVEDAAFLLEVAGAQPQDRRPLLLGYARQHGRRLLADLFAEFMALSLSVSTNASDFVWLVLVEAGFHPERSELPNLPSILGALRGVEVATLCATEVTCGGCAYRLGTQANQAPITIQDASDAADGEFTFNCHEDLDGRGEPTRKCVGWAAVSRLRREVQHELGEVPHQHQPNSSQQPQRSEAPPCRPESCATGPTAIGSPSSPPRANASSSGCS